MPPLSKVKVKQGRGGSRSMYTGRPPSLSRSHSAPGAPRHNQSPVSPTIAMPDDVPHKSPAEFHGITIVPHDVTVPVDLQTGIAVTKVSPKESKKVTVRLDADLGQIFYQSRRTRISESLSLFHTRQIRGSSGDLPPFHLGSSINSPVHVVQIENIKELRSGSDARYYRQQFGLGQETEAKWLTIVYVMGAGYKTLHLISPDVNKHQMLDITIRKLQTIREELKNGSGGLEMRQAIWEKQYWKSSDEEKDQKLDFNDVEKMCHRLNLDPPRGELRKRFDAADEEQKGTLDFAAFRRFVKALKARPELERIFNKLTEGSDGKLTFPLFLDFMRNTQKVCWLCASIITGNHSSS